MELCLPGFIEKFCHTLPRCTVPEHKVYIYLVPHIWQMSRSRVRGVTRSTGCSGGLYVVILFLERNIRDT